MGKLGKSSPIKNCANLTLVLLTTVWLSNVRFQLQQLARERGAHRKGRGQSGGGGEGGRARKEISALRQKECRSRVLKQDEAGR